MKNSPRPAGATADSAARAAAHRRQRAAGGRLPEALCPTPRAGRLADRDPPGPALQPARRPGPGGRDPRSPPATCRLHLLSLEHPADDLDRPAVEGRRSPNSASCSGGPEITGDNRWVLEQPAIDLAAIGEGEQTFVDLLAALARRPCDRRHPRAMEPRRQSAGAALGAHRSGPGQLALHRRHSRRRRGADHAHGNLARLPLSLQVLLLPEELRLDLSHVGRADRGQLAARLPAGRKGNLPARPHAQPAARLRRLPPPAGPGQSRPPVHLLGRTAGGRHPSPRPPGCFARPTSRRSKSACNRSTPRPRS